MKKIIISSLAVATLAMAGSVFAQTVSVSEKGRGQSMSSATGTESVKMREQGDARASATGTQAREEAKKKAEGGQGDAHRSEVAKFVQTLLNAADRMGGIGERVRMVANEQASSTEKVANAIEKVEKRSKIKTLLIGSDYKNLGEIRSEIVTTANRLERLSREIEGMASSTEKTAVAAEIQSLKDEQAKLETFVKTNESKFSIFGWAVRLFQK